MRHIKLFEKFVLPGTAQEEIMACPFNYSGSKSEYTELHRITEPVVDLFGGGGGFWSNVKADKVFVNDVNEPLVRFQELVYKSTDEEYKEIIKKLHDITSAVDTREKYETIRAEFNKTKDPVLFMAVLSMCTNNMIRFNKSGGFNQTWGKRKFNASMQAKLDAFRERIKDKDIEFHVGSFDSVTGKDNWIFFVDPPYLVSVAGYNSGWGEPEEHRLYDFLRGKRFVMTNFLRKGSNVNEILKAAIEKSGWKTNNIRSGKMKAQRDLDQTFEELVIADSDETLNKVLGNKLF